VFSLDCLSPLAAINLASPQDILPELVRRIKPSAVAIETYDSRGEKLSRGNLKLIASLLTGTSLKVRIG
jgi:hypothetical protein